MYIACFAIRSIDRCDASHECVEIVMENEMQLRQINPYDKFYVQYRDAPFLVAER